LRKAISTVMYMPAVVGKWLILVKRIMVRIVKAVVGFGAAYTTQPSAFAKYSSMTPVRGFFARYSAFAIAFDVSMKYCAALTTEPKVMAKYAAFDIAPGASAKYNAAFIYVSGV